MIDWFKKPVKRTKRQENQGGSGIDVLLGLLCKYLLAEEPVMVEIDEEFAVNSLSSSQASDGKKHK